MKAEKTRGVGMGFGGSTLLLIFGVLCLITFSVLALVSARSDYRLMEKTVLSVTEYYEADGKGEEFLALVDKELKNLRSQCRTEAEFYQKTKESFADYYDEESRTLSAQIEMNQRLHLEVVLQVAFLDAGSRQFQVESYQTVQNGVLEIDTSMPVWTGTKETEQ